MAFSSPQPFSMCSFTAARAVLTQMRRSQARWTRPRPRKATRLRIPRARGGPLRPGLDAAASAGRPRPSVRMPRRAVPPAGCAAGCAAGLSAGTARCPTSAASPQPTRSGCPFKSPPSRVRVAVGSPYSARSSERSMSSSDCPAASSFASTDDRSTKTACSRPASSLYRPRWRRWTSV